MLIPVNELSAAEISKNLVLVDSGSLLLGMFLVILIAYLVGVAVGWSILAKERKFCLEHFKDFSEFARKEAMKKI